MIQQANIVIVNGEETVLVPSSTPAPAPSTSIKQSVGGGDIWESWMGVCRADPGCRERWTEHGAAIARAATAHDVPTTLLIGVAYHESSLDPTVQGDDGHAHGMFQLNARWHPLPEYGSAFKPYNVGWAATYAARWLHDLAQTRGGDWCAAIDAYQGKARSHPHSYAEEIWSCDSTHPLG